MSVKIISVILVILYLTSIDAKESRAKQNFHCNDALNIQIKIEFDASQNYLSLANYFASDTVALDGFAKMMEHSWKEELGHGEKLISYVIKRGGSIKTPSVARPINDTLWSTMNVCQIIENVLKLEMQVHDSLLKVHKCASGYAESNTLPEDPHLQDFIEEEYLSEQVEANKELADLLTKIERTTLHRGANETNVSLCDGLGLHIIDQELSAKFSK